MDLDPNGLPVELDGVTLVTPGLQGTVEVQHGSGAAVRAVEETRPQLIAALQQTDVREQLTVVIRNPVEVPLGRGVRTRSTPHGQDGIEITVPGPGSGYGQMVLAVAENGALSWHTAAPGGVTPMVRGVAGARTYVIPRTVAPVAGAPATRGILGVAGKKLVKVLAFKLMDRVAGEVGDFFVRRWEAEHRKPRLRRLTSQNVTDPGVPDLTGADLRAMGGRALLFVHGTGHLTHSAFSRVPASLLDHLHDRYAGRMIAFDHPSVGPTPTENVAWLADFMRASGATLDVDVVAHSRGGLVARVLSERPADANLAPDSARVGTVVFVGTPNAGTALAEFDRLGSFVDRLTNLLHLIPDNPVTDPLATIISIVKQLAVGALKGLDGLTSMTPGRPYLERLNRPSNASSIYRAVASNYEPAAESPLATIARNKGIDFVFGQQENDLVVPMAGVYASNGASKFPIDDPVVFGSAVGVEHSTYWPRPELADAFDRWLVP